MERAVLYFNKFLKSLESEKNRSLEDLKSKKQEGFSLIELLVSISILTTLAAIGIPSYSGYKKHTARTVLDANGTTVQRAFAACITTKPFNHCDSLAELKVGLSDSFSEESAAPKYCIQIEKDVGGKILKGCYSMDAKTGVKTTLYNENFCYREDSSTAPCINGLGLPDEKRWGYQGGTCDPIVTPLVPCNSHADCIPPNGRGGLCNTSGFEGLCNSKGNCF